MPTKLSPGGVSSCPAPQQTSPSAGNRTGPTLRSTPLHLQISEMPQLPQRPALLINVFSTLTQMLSPGPQLHLPLFSLLVQEGVLTETRGQHTQIPPTASPFASNTLMLREFLPFPLLHSHWPLQACSAPLSPALPSVYNRCGLRSTEHALRALPTPGTTPIFSSSHFLKK